MKNLRVWQKLALMGLVFIAPFAIITYDMVASVNTLGVEFARQEIRGLDYYAPLSTLLHDLQLHRGMSALVASGDGSFQGALASKSVELENDLRRMDETDKRLGANLGTSKDWLALRSACSKLLSESSNLSAEENFAQHTQVIEDAIALITHVGDTSNLTLDPDIDSYYLMNVLVFQGPELREALAQARGLGSRLTLQHTVAAEKDRQMHRLTVLADEFRGKVDVSLRKAMDFNPALVPALQAPARASDDAAEKNIRLFEQSIGDDPPKLSAAQYFSAASTGVDRLFALEDTIDADLRQLLDRRIEKFQGQVRRTLAWPAAGLLLALLFGIVIARDISVSLRRVIDTANQIATGNLAEKTVVVSRKDEVGVLAAAFERMRSELTALVGQVQVSGIQVNSSVTEIAATSRQQQATANEMAATTSEIGATSKQIAATASDLLKTMTAVSEAAEDSATLANNGQAALTQMEETMHRIMAATGSINAKLAVLNEKAGNITQMVTTITKVADQTNLLSLNAAIEAEKAGEYGRGFAVVATQIRRLADQTAVATYDIEQMVKEIQSAVSAGVMGMDKFAEEVRRGTHEVQQVAGQLSQVIQNVQAMAPRCETVNDGMQAQANGAEQITQALMQLSEAAQQTVASLQQSGQAITDLNQAAGDLRAGVVRFKLEA